jgi:hypothetical protein
MLESKLQFSHACSCIAGKRLRGEADLLDRSQWDPEMAAVTGEPEQGGGFSAV